MRALAESLDVSSGQRHRHRRPHGAARPRRAPARRRRPARHPRRPDRRRPRARSPASPRSAASSSATLLDELTDDELDGFLAALAGPAPRPRARLAASVAADRRPADAATRPTAHRRGHAMIDLFRQYLPHLPLAARPRPDPAARSRRSPTCTCPSSTPTSSTTASPRATSTTSCGPAASCSSSPFLWCRRRSSASTSAPRSRWASAATSGAAIFRKVETFSQVEVNTFGAASLITRNTNDVQQVQQVVLLALTHDDLGADPGRRRPDHGPPPGRAAVGRPARDHPDHGRCSSGP